MQMERRSGVSSLVPRSRNPFTPQFPISNILIHFPADSDPETHTAAKTVLSGSHVRKQTHKVEEICVEMLQLAFYDTEGNTL